MIKQRFNCICVAFAVGCLSVYTRQYGMQSNERIKPIDLEQSIPASARRIPKGIWKSPYSMRASVRYALNFLTNGYFSYKNPDHNSMQPLPLQGVISFDKDISQALPIKIIFLGDIMVSQSGNSPHLDATVSELLKSADVIVANIESPVVDAKNIIKRGLSLKFQMPVSYLQSIYNHNPNAWWVFSIANNHAFDTSNKSVLDISGLEDTVRLIKRYMPNAQVIGTHIDSAKSILALQVKNGCKIGFIGWTEVMNNDKQHINKPIVRGEDIDSYPIESIKKEAGIDILIGFPHGNEEQSYEPLKSTRDRWIKIVGPTMFDIIVGTGPHVVQLAEEKNNRFIFHSIGNFFSPKGKSQTKVGCIPEFIIQPNGEGKMSMKYHIHFLQQQGDNVSLFKLDDKNVSYPDIVNRLKDMWSIFNVSSM